MKTPAIVITKVFKDEEGNQKFMQRNIGFFEKDEGSTRVVLDGLVDYSRLPRDNNGNLIIIEQPEDKKHTNE